MLPRLALLAVVLLACRVSAAPAARFTGEQSCASSSCHGGGVGKDQCIIWQKKDVHTRANAILGNARSTRIAEALGIADATKDAHCTVCHSPLQSVPPERFVAGVKPDAGVSCETCHGPAEEWLRFHTRRDVSHEQRVATGLREVVDLSSRANVCIACHLNISSELVRAGHPEMFFELDGQMKSEPPHWKDEGAWIGPRAWLTGQAAALRELSWKVASKPEEAGLLDRWKALGWLLRQTAPGANALPASDAADFKAMQSAADRLAHSAARADWSRESASALLRKLAATSGAFREAGAPPAEMRRRAEVLILGIDRLWQALLANGAAPAPTFDTALKVAAGEARKQDAFEPTRFAGALEQVEVALERMGK